MITIGNVSTCLYDSLIDDHVELIGVVGMDTAAGTSGAGAQRENPDLDTNRPISDRFQLPMGGAISRETMLLYWVEACSTPVMQFASTARDIVTTIDGGIYSHNREKQLSQARADLSKRQQRVIENVVDKLFVDMRESFESKLHEMSQWLVSGPGAQLGLHVDDGRSSYPLAPEQFGMSMRLLLESGGLPENLQPEIEAAVSTPSAARYMITLLESRGRPDPAIIVFPALLATAVSRLEEYLAGLVRVALFIHPRGMDLKSMQFSISDLDRYKIPEMSLRMAAIDQKSRTVTEGHPDEWRKQIQKWPGIDIGQAVADWSALVENVLRRHAVIHNSGLVDDRYLTRIPQGVEVPHLGSQLPVAGEYLSSAINRIECLAAVLSARWPKKLMRTIEPNPFFAIYVYTAALEREDWPVAKTVTDALVECLSGGRTREIARVNNWLARIQLANDDAARNDIREEIDNWTPSEEGNDFVFARLLLLEHDDEACMLLGRPASRGGIELSEAKTWPLVQMLIKRSSRARQIFSANSPNPDRSGRRSGRSRRR